MAHLHIGIRTLGGGGPGAAPWALPGAEDEGFPRLIRLWRFESYGLPCQELPISVLLLPDCQNAELHRVGLAVAFAFARERVPHNGGSADDVDRLVRQGDELPPRLATSRVIDKLGFVLDPARRMAIAQLICGEGLKLAPIGLERRVAECLHGLCYGRLVAGLRHHR